MPDIDRVDMGRAVLEEAIGEAAGGGAGIEGSPSLGGDCETLQGALEFLTTPADER
jgi:hypothetical protein